MSTIRCATACIHIYLYCGYIIDTKIPLHVYKQDQTRQICILEHKFNIYTTNNTDHLYLPLIYRSARQ